MRPEQQAQSPIQNVGVEQVRDQDKIHLIFSYLGILALIPLLTVKDSPYVKWHAVHGLVLGVGVGILITVASALIAAITVGAGSGLGCLLWVGLIVTDLYCMSKGLKGEKVRLPVVTDLAEKFLRQ